MNKDRKYRIQNDSGASLIEAMVAAAMLAGAALTVYPIIFQTKKLVKHGDFYEQCINAARTKLNEYKVGQIVNFSSLPAPYDLLTAETAAGAVNPSGFAYAKSRYNLEIANYCPTAGPTIAARTVSTMPPSNLADLGRQECIVGLGTGNPLSCGAASTIDQRMLETTAGHFKLYVNLRRYNPSLGLDYSKNPPVLLTDPNATEDCFQYTVNGRPLYDFQQSGDMIKITVTGVVDLSAGGNFAGISQGSAKERELTCQISDFLKPHNQIARYWLQEDGRFYRWAGTGAPGSQWEVFKSLASAGNMGIAASPDNRTAYVLRQGALVRFSNCGGEPLDCPNQQQTWSINDNIVSIAAQFTAGLPSVAGGPLQPHLPTPTCGSPDMINGIPVIFGLMADRQTVVCINLPAASLPAIGGAPVPTSAYTVVDTPGGARIPFAVPNQANRVHSIFSDGAMTSAYAVDLTCSTFLNATYCGGIYSTSDIQMLYPLEVFNVRAIAFSK